MMFDEDFHDSSMVLGDRLLESILSDLVMEMEQGLIQRGVPGRIKLVEQLNSKRDTGLSCSVISELIPNCTRCQDAGDVQQVKLRCSPESTGRTLRLSCRFIECGCHSAHMTSDMAPDANLAPQQGVS